MMTPTLFLTFALGVVLGLTGAELLAAAAPVLDAVLVPAA